MKHRNALSGKLHALFIAICLPSTAPAQTPLSELGLDTYQGYTGGLYPNGSNEPPPLHAAAALDQGRGVRPRDPSGRADGQGLIGLISLGMSNPTQEFRALERDEDLAAERNGAVVLVNGAKGSVASERWRDPNDPIWIELDQRLAAAGLTPAQVQVAWMKFAQATPADNFPLHAQNLQADLQAIVQIARQRFPNLRLAFASNRIYGGYNTRPGRNEPVSYESGFALKWLIEAQINGAAELNFAADRGPVRAPLLLWATDLWANGAHARGDGLSWVAPQDYDPDLVHPSVAGEYKVSGLWRPHLRVPPARSWFIATTGDRRITTVPVEADATVTQAMPSTNLGTATELRIQGGSQITRSYLRFTLPASAQPYTRAELVGYTLRASSVEVHRAAGSFVESTINFNNAPALQELLSAAPTMSSDESSYRIDVSALLDGQPTSEVNLVLVTSATALQSVASREGTGGPLLVLSTAADQILHSDFETDLSL